ncbi:hypothetical protein [Salininema proteolyticum]|uniref:Lipoprotein n=1 Tax=Salininema proteolyticum TaxID=1607685 RepID=A0ABV8TXR6_9ACTN
MRMNLLPLALLPVFLTACTDDPPEPEPEPDYPTVVDAVAVREDGAFTVHITVDSAYDSEERWADAVRVVGPDGGEMAIAEFPEPHEDEQPFTRSIEGVDAPMDVEVVEVQARDSENGWNPETLEVRLDGG